MATGTEPPSARDVGPIARRAPRVRRLHVALAVLAVLALVLLGIGRWLGSDDGLQWVAERAERASGGRLSLERPVGSLFGTVRVGRVRWHDGPLTVAVDDASVTPGWRGLLQGRLHLRELAARHVEVVTEPAPDAPPAAMPDALRLPLALELGEIRVDALVLREAGAAAPLRLAGLSAALRYDRSGWILESARLSGPFGVLQAGARLGDVAPFPLDGRLLLETQALDEPIAVDAVLGGDLAATTLEARTVLRDASLSARLRLAPFGPVPLAGLRLSLGALDLARFDAALPATRIEGTLEADAPSDPPPETVSGAPRRWPPLAGSLQLRNAIPGPVDGGRLPLGQVAARWSLLGDRLRLDGLELAGPAGRLVGDVSLDVPAGMPTLTALPAFELRLATDSFDLRRLHGTLRATALRGVLRLAPEAGGLGFDARLADGGLSFEAHARLVGETVEILRARLQARDGVALLQGRAGVVAPFVFELAGSVAAFDPSRFAEVPAGSLNGDWQASGRIAPATSVDASLRLAASRWRGLPLSGSVAARFDPDRLTRLDASLRLGASALTVRGALGAPDDRLDVALDAARLAEIDPRLAGRLELQGQLRGALRDPGLEASASVRELAFDGRARAQRATARLEFSRLGDLLGLLARAGAIEAASAAPPASAPASASASATAPLAAALEVEGLRIDDVAVDTLRAGFEGDADRHGLSVRVASRALRLEGRARLQGGFGSGTPARWTGRLTELVNDASPTLRLLEPAALSLAADAVSASSLRVRIDGDDGALLTLDDAAWSPTRVALKGALSGAPLRWLESVVAAPELRVHEEIALRLGARFDVSGRPGPGGGLAGRIEAFRESGDLVVDLPAAEGGTERIAAGLQTLQAALDIGDERVRATLEVRGAQLGTIGGEAGVPLRWGPDGLTPRLDVPLDGRGVLDVPSLAFTRVLTGEAWRFDGALQARVALAGTLAAPRISGRLTGSGLVAEQREYGMKLTDGTLAADLRDNLVDIETLRFASGQGSVSMSGSLRPDERSEAVLVLERLPIPLGAGQRLLLSGEARASLSRGVLRLRGALRADEGLIELTAQNAPRVARDVVVVADTAEATRRWNEGVARRDAARARAAARANGLAQGNGAAAAADATPAQAAAGAAEAEAAPRRGFQVRSNLEIDLGDAFRVFGAGVDARLAGKLALRGTLPDAPRLTGTVRVVQGTYTGFGQKLEIERGSLVFSGPVDNPAIDIVAFRRYLPVEAGVALTGTARTPRIALVSKPDVPEPDKLSWLVLGVGSDTARSGGESAALQTAAATLLAATDPNASGPGFASTFGLDVLSIRTSQVGSSGDTGSAAASAQDSIVTLGKRMTERLFVSYEQSLRGLQNLLRLQYEITERLQVRTRVGSQNAVDLLWTYRYD